MKIKKNKPLKFFLGLMILFSLFLYVFLKPYDYEKKYQVNGFKIREKYNKKNGYYEFMIDYNEITYPFIIKSKYYRKRELINEIEVAKNALEVCLLPVSNDLSFYPLCSNKKDIYTINLSKIKDLDFKYREIKKIDKKYQNLTLNYLGDLKVFVNNYKGFHLVSEEEQKDIDLFSKDVYTMSLIYQLGNYLIVPDYETEYYFNKMFIIDMKNGKVKEIKLKDGISFDSVFLGEHKNNVYLLDKKEEQEYKIDLKKKKIEKVDFQILENGKMINSSFKNIVNQNLNMFPKSEIVYKIIDEKLYMEVAEILIKISNQPVKKVIQNNFDEVYYLVDYSLYMFNNFDGEVKVLSNFEWNFNNYNNIFIYK